MQNNNKNQCFIVDVDDSNIRIDNAGCITFKNPEAY